MKSGRKDITLLILTSPVGSKNDNIQRVNSIGSADHDMAMVEARLGWPDRGIGYSRDVVCVFNLASSFNFSTLNTCKTYFQKKNVIKAQDWLFPLRAFS